MDDFNLTWLANGAGGSRQPGLQAELRRLGVGPYACRHMSAKGDFYALRAENLRAPAANILKQEFLAKGAEAAVHPQVILGQPERSAVLMLATAAQYKHICEGLRRQQFGLPALAAEIEQALLNIGREEWQLPVFGQNRQMTLSTNTQIMGILNLTPDSFSDGGSYASVEQAVERALQMQSQGAYIIDVGGESTRPGHQQISEAEEISRVEPVIRALRAVSDVLISIDTYKPAVARAALAAGADMINDIWGLTHDSGMAELIAKHKASVCIMHNAQKTLEGDIWKQITAFLQKSVSLALDAGIGRNKICLDGGIGFAKTKEQNHELLNGYNRLAALGYPLLLGTSRKSMFGGNVEDRLLQTVESTRLAAKYGVTFVRVHDVKENFEAIREVYGRN